MRKTFVVSLCVLFALSLLAVGAYAKNSQSKVFEYKPMQTPTEPANPSEIGGSMFRAAAVSTVTLGWWQFDGPGGPNAQGWTKHDVTAQVKLYWHVDGNAAAPCNGITPVNGQKSMWCGQWATTTPPWCGWGYLPGYGNSWDQSLETTVTGTSLTYTIVWSSELGYDYTYVEWWNGSAWVADPNANAGVGFYDDVGGPYTETLASPGGLPAKVRFHFTSDGAFSDEDNGDSGEGAAKVDDLVFGGGTENWEGESCLANTSQDGKWIATFPPGFGEYGNLYSATAVLQQDPCLKPISYLWAWFDDPSVTNYACGGWPLVGAMPYGPSPAGMYMQDEVWSPFVPITGTGSEFMLECLIYRDLPMDNLQFYLWHVRTKDNDPPGNGCPTSFADFNFVYYGDGKDWQRRPFQMGALIPSNTADEISVAVGAIDMAGVWTGINGSGNCHSHAPLIDQVKVMRVGTFGAQFTERDIDLWQDNFPENGDITPTSYARCDMALDITAGTKKGIVPGDSMVIREILDPQRIATDNTGGRNPRQAVYAFVRVTDRFGNPVAGKNGVAIQSPDNTAFSGKPDPFAGMLRWPFVAGVAPAGWDAYRFDRVYSNTGARTVNRYCVDLMDLGWSKHVNENVAANTGIFAPGDVINYFIAVKNLAGVWTYWTRDFHGQGSNALRTNVLSTAIANAMEWSVLPDAGRNPGDEGDILYVDDADDRGGPAQAFFDIAFNYLGIKDRVDRFDVLGPSSVVGNSLASRVKSVDLQIIGDPVQIYKKVLWNSTDLSAGLMGDGGTPNGGTSSEKSNDFALCYKFLDESLDNPAWAFWGDDAATDWNGLLGVGAVNTRSIYMNFAAPANDQAVVSTVVSPVVYPVVPAAPVGYFNPTESFYAFGGCGLINDFDVPTQSGLSRAALRYANASTGQTAALSQPTVNGTSTTTARFFLAGFGFNFIRDNDLNGVPDYVKHLQELLVWFENLVPAPTGIDPVAFNKLDDNYPNPFNPTTTIKYSIAENGRVTLKIYNAAGQLVRTLIDEEQAPQAGGFSKVWNGMNEQSQPVASGVYFYQLTAKDFSQTKKMVLLK